MAEIDAKNGLVKIDGQEASAVDYTRVVDGDQVTYDLRFRMGRKVVHRVKGVDANEMVHTLGVENAGKIHRIAGEKGSLSGTDLSVHEGLSPQAQESAIEQAVQFELNKSSVKEADVGSATVSPDKKRFLESVARRAAEQHHEEGKEQEEKGPNAAAKQPNPEPAKALTQELERRRSAQLEALKKQFIVMDSRYYFKDKANTLAFQDKGSRLVTAEKGPAVAEALIKMIVAKGWTTVKVNGSHEFKRDLWIQAEANGVRMPGYSPTDADRAAALHLIEARSTNTVERGREPEKARGEQRDSVPQEQGKKGEPTREQIDAKRKQAQRIEDYNPLRPGDTPMVDKAKVIGRVVHSIAAARIKNPETRQRVEQEVQRRLAQLEAAGGRVPTIKVFDQRAPSQNRGAEKAKAADHHRAERTR
ncbi:LPD7 domain-containing protein [Stenotrophomonas sp. STK17_22]|uniref:LPD7 domain-containing protein n=1 Tax=Stenotrophomonas sp. STK17_22 TaxID=3455201 RepID=UPI003F7DEAA7